MKTPLRHGLVLGLALASWFAPLTASSQTATPTAGAPESINRPAPAPKPDAALARPKRDNGRFLQLHAAFLARAQAGPVGLLFLGDSITEGWTSVPELWERTYGAYQPANFGISGDQTMGVIWRIENGELDHVKPKVVVVLIGTNNTTLHTAEEIAGANRRIVQLIREKLPETKVLLLSIFPRGPRKNADGSTDPFEQRMAVITETNRLLARLDDGKTVRVLDIGDRFRAPDGSLPQALMPDQLHLSPAGYEVWATAMAPLLTEMLQR